MTPRTDLPLICLAYFSQLFYSLGIISTEGLNNTNNSNNNNNITKK